ncbi:MAG: SDR family oxidoreductase [Bacteroidetes bacterium]|nr:SDR family oxidoreductase [Bacteroidota bacterium]
MQTPFHLNGKTVLVTGASSGIGRKAAIDCSTFGARMVLTGRNVERLNETLSQLSGEGHLVLPCDLLDEKAITAFAKEIPALDGVVHCAGLVKPFPIAFLNAAKLNEIIHTNFYAPALLTAALFKAKKISDGASLVFLSSISGQFPGKGNVMYASSKAALEAFAKTVAAEYVGRNIRSNCISPAMVKTPMYDYSSEGLFEEAMNEHVSKYPLGVGYPEDVANAIIFFLSPASRWITGVNLYMDGGFLLSN